MELLAKFLGPSAPSRLRDAPSPVEGTIESANWDRELVVVRSRPQSGTGFELEPGFARSKIYQGAEYGARRTDKSSDPENQEVVRERGYKNHLFRPDFTSPAQEDRGEGRG